MDYSLFIIEILICPCYVPLFVRETFQQLLKQTFMSLLKLLLLLYQQSHSLHNCITLPAIIRNLINLYKPRIEFTLVLFKHSTQHCLILFNNKLRHRTFAAYPILLCVISAFIFILLKISCNRIERL